MDISGNNNLSRVETGYLARAVTRLEEVNVSNTYLTVEQVTAICRAVCEEAIMKLKVLLPNDSCAPLCP